MRTVYYLALTTLVALLIWGQLAAKTWQEVAEQAQHVALEAAYRTNACIDELRTASQEEEEADSTVQPQ